MATSKEELQRKGRDATVAYLERVGMSIIETGHYTPVGEIPILASDNGLFVYVGYIVKGKDATTIGPSKAELRRAVKRMKYYLTEMDLDDPYRIDYVTLMILTEDRALLRHQRALEV